MALQIATFPFTSLPIRFAFFNVLFEATLSE
jgi:hypothetical protein